MLPSSRGGGARANLERKMESSEQSETEKLIREVLGETYAHLKVRRVFIEEDLEQLSTSITCEVTEEATGENSIIAGKGVGVIDAFFNGFVTRFAGEYPSLKTIRFTSFHVGGQLDTRSAFAGTDSKGEVTVDIMNSAGKVFRFGHASRSVISSSIITILLALEYFVNSERAFVAVYEAFQDARERKRNDLVQHYTGQMSVLVRNTSYSEVIERLRAHADL
jgi:hypothetical protein